MIGTTLGFAVMILGPLTGGAFNPARWFGPALVGNAWGDSWACIVGPIVGALLAALFFRFVVESRWPGPSHRGRRRAVKNAAADLAAARLAGRAGRPALL